MSSCVSVFVLTLIDFTVSFLPWTSWLMSQLLTRLADQDSGERCIQEEAHVHVGEGLTTALGIGRCCVPWTWTLSLLKEVKWVHQHYHVLSYNQVILLGQPSYLLIQISCLLAMAMRGRQWCGLMSSKSSTLKHKRW